LRNGLNAKLMMGTRRLLLRKSPIGKIPASQHPGHK